MMEDESSSSTTAPNSALLCAEFSSKIRIKLPSSKACNIIRQCLEVDEELQPEKIIKQFEAFDDILEM